MQNSPPSHIRFLPGFAIFINIVIFLVFLPQITNFMHHYQMGDYTPQELAMYLLFMVFFLGIFVFLNNFYLLSTVRIDERSGIEISSRFARNQFEWHQIESISFIISREGETLTSSHGYGPLFLTPYFFHTRWVYIQLRSISGKCIHVWVRINLNKVNSLFHFLTNVLNFRMTRNQVNFSELKGKKYNNPIRNQWLFEKSSHSQDTESTHPFIYEENGQEWSSPYSSKAKTIFSLGLVWVINFWGLYFLKSENILFHDQPVIWTILISVGVGSFCIGLLLMAFTPEFKQKRTYY